MRRTLWVILLIAGCSGAELRQPAGVSETRSEVTDPINCVVVGGGELQPGLTLGLGSATVRVTQVQRRGNDPVGFSIDRAAAPGVFSIVTAGGVSCSDGAEYSSATPIARVDFCTGGSGCI